jgi:hypothetical protein
MAPYWRYAIELFPEFKKKRIPIARFLCRRRGKTFSLLPIQLIPYFQYTAGAVMGTLFLGMGGCQTGQRGFHGASAKVDEVDPESLVTPWLITCWLVMVVRGLRRGNAVLRQSYNLDGIHTSGAWEEAAAYFAAFGLRPKVDRLLLLMDLVYRYSRRTGQFLFGTPSQYRGSLRPRVFLSQNASGVVRLNSPALPCPTAVGNFGPLVLRAGAQSFANGRCLYGFIMGFMIILLR